jgi:hypothetical protein
MQRLQNGFLTVPLEEIIDKVSVEGVSIAKVNDAKSIFLIAIPLPLVDFPDPLDGLPTPTCAKTILPVTLAKVQKLSLSVPTDSLN